MPELMNPERLCWLVLPENVDITHFATSEDCEDSLKQQDSLWWVIS